MKNKAITQPEESLKKHWPLLVMYVIWQILMSIVAYNTIPENPYGEYLTVYEVMFTVPYAGYERIESPFGRIFIELVSFNLLLVLICIIIYLLINEKRNVSGKV